MVEKSAGEMAGEAFMGMLQAQGMVIGMLVQMLEERGTIPTGIFVEMVGFAAGKLKADPKTANAEQMALSTFSEGIYRALATMQQMRQGTKLSG